MPQRRRAGLFNVLAAVFLGLSVISCGWMVGIAMNPYGRLNPFPPSKALEPWARVTAVVFPTQTETPNPTPDTPTPEPATPTQTATVLPIETVTPMSPVTVTPAKTDTPTPSQTPLRRQGTATRTASPTPRTTAVWTQTPTVTPTPGPTRSVLTYTASITYQVHPVQVCDWMGVAGMVADLQGRPSLGAFVRVWGLGNIDQIVAAGSYPRYGPSGWEVRLARAQIVGEWTVQLISSPEARLPLSEAYRISMPGDCKKNLAWVRFQQNH